MKKRVIIVWCGIFLLILGRFYAASWFSTGIDTIKNATRHVKVEVENLFKKNSKNNEKFEQFKQNLLELQQQIDQQLAAVDDQATEVESLENAQNLLKQLFEHYDALIKQAQQELSEKDFKELQKDIIKQQAVVATLFNKLKIATKLWDIFKEQATGYTKTALIKNNPYKNKIARVIEDQQLSAAEQEYLKNRASQVHRGLEQFFNQPLAPDMQLNMAFSGSGGGYRAMILTLGYLLGLQQIGLYDALLYSSTLSGSTWLQAPYIQMNKSLQEYKQILLHEIERQTFDLVKVQYLFSASDINALVNDLLWPKFIFGLPIGSIDIYGSLLARALMSSTLKHYQQQYLSDQWNTVKTGSVPFPLYTAVSMHKTTGNEYLYNWYEFNPLEIRNLEINMAIPSYAFGWEFDAGVSKEAAPLQSIGYLMGIWGSAYNVNMKDINKIVLKKLESSSTLRASADWLKHQTIALTLKMVGQTPYIGKIRASPAQVNNPFKNMKNISGWLSQKPYLVFVDGGIDYNIPLRPLWRKERNIKVIIVGDSSGNVSDKELLKAFDDAKRVYGYKYTRVDNHETETLHLYKDLKHPEAPRIIYITFIKDQVMLDREKQGSSLYTLAQEHDLRSFDAARCVKEEHCGTFNVGDYTEKQFLQLMNMAYFNVLANKERIMQFLVQEFGVGKKITVIQ